VLKGFWFWMPRLAEKTQVGIGDIHLELPAMNLELCSKIVGCWLMVDGGTAELASNSGKESNR